MHVATRKIFVITMMMVLTVMMAMMNSHDDEGPADEPGMMIKTVALQPGTKQLYDIARN